MESTTESLDHTLGRQLARHLREVHLGGNWCENNYRDIMQDLSVAEINDSSTSNNSILKLCYHTHYYVKVLARVLAGEPLNSRDADSFLHPEILTQDELQTFAKLIIDTAEATAVQLEKMDAKQLSSFFGSEKYGSIFRNTFGIIEHLNYHLGQLVLLKKQLRTKNITRKH
jgi:uncharacterized damage-inducible protein DinB